MNPVGAIFSSLIVSFLVAGFSAELFGTTQENEPWVFVSCFIVMMLINMFALVFEPLKSNKDEIKRIEKERKKLIDSL